MDDLELTKLAAKAAGGKFISASKFGDLYEIGGRQFFWNPLRDDGDALRLAIKLRFEIQCYPGMGGVIYDDGSPDGAYIQQNPEKGQSDEQAVRRAIVRAAAEMAPE